MEFSVTQIPIPPDTASNYNTVERMISLMSLNKMMRVAAMVAWVIIAISAGGLCAVSVLAVSLVRNKKVNS